MIPLYVDLVQSAPEFSEAAGDLAYLRLLTGDDIPGSLKISEQLLEKDPNNLARISAAALGRIKTGYLAGAQRLYEGKVIDWEKAPQPWKAVHYAVLMAAGDPSADSFKSSISVSELRPEERTLMSPSIKKTVP